MSNQEGNLLDALEGLLEERRRYEGWIAQLEERRAHSPSHVVDRVRSDYQARLDGVTGQLRGRMGDLEASAATLAGRISELEREETTRRDERAETELRALVGEFAPDAAHESMARSDESLAKLASEREVHSAELNRVNDILALVRPRPVPGPRASEPAAAPAPPNEQSYASALDTSNVVGGHSDAAAAPVDQFAHMDDAESIAPVRVEAAPSASHEDVGHRPAVPPSAPLPMESPLADELAFLHSVVDSRSAPTRHDSQAPETRATAANGDLLPPPVLTAPSRPATPAVSPAVTQRDAFPSNSPNRTSSLTPGSIPAFLKDMPTEQVKTLKCSECGTMNYPTEWYCERCGGELAAM